ncbi:MAG: preprotein translocase subunit SecE [Bdellovibrionales bacterium]|nr:preprotein translocase subunit SecE [Bdellovibrionales bacterium]
MEQDNSKILTVTFAATGFLAGLVVRVLMDTLQGVSGFFVRLYSIESVKHGLPIAVGLLVFLILQFSPKVRQYADECVVEVRKVVWPTQKETSAMTTVVCVMLLISGLILGVFDMVAGNLIKLILN